MTFPNKYNKKPVQIEAIQFDGKNSEDVLRFINSGEKKSNGGTQFYNQNRIYDNKIATAIPTSFQPYYLDNERERE